MFFFRHPRPVTDGRAVAVQLAEQKTAADKDLQVLIAPDPKETEAPQNQPANPAT